MKEEIQNNIVKFFVHKYLSERLYSFIIVLLMMLVFPSVTFSQFRDRPPMRYGINLASYYLDPMVFYNSDSAVGRLDLYLDLPLSTLQFKYDRSKKIYDAAFEYSITLTDADDKTVADNSFSESISNSEDQQKNISSTSLYRVKHFYLSPGKYKIHFKLKDDNSQNEYPKVIDLTVKDKLVKPLIFSDIMLLSEYSIDLNGKKEITPIVNGYIGNAKSFYIFFEVLNNSDSEVTANFECSLYNEDGKNIWKETYIPVLKPGINQMFEKIVVDKIITPDYKLEIIDKNTNEVVANKIVSGISHNLPFQRRGYGRNI
jgi:hypothetical protein